MNTVCIVLVANNIIIDPRYCQVMASVLHFQLYMIMYTFCICDICLSVIKISILVYIIKL